MKAEEMNTPCSGPHFLKHGKDSRAAWKEQCRVDEQPILVASVGTWVLLCSERQRRQFMPKQGT